MKRPMLGISRLGLQAPIITRLQLVQHRVMSRSTPQGAYDASFFRISVLHISVTWTLSGKIDVANYLCPVIV